MVNESNQIAISPHHLLLQ